MFLAVSQKNFKKPPGGLFSFSLGVFFFFHPIVTKGSTNQKNPTFSLFLPTFLGPHTPYPSQGRPYPPPPPIPSHSAIWGNNPFSPTDYPLLFADRLPHPNPYPLVFLSPPPPQRMPLPPSPPPPPLGTLFLLVSSPFPWGFPLGFVLAKVLVFFGGRGTPPPPLSGMWVFSHL